MKRRNIGLIVMALALTGCTPTAPPETAVQPDTLSKIDNMLDSGGLDISGWQKNMPEWFAAVEPYKIIGEDQSAVYFVGTQGLGMYFIPTDEGHIVIDGGMPGQGAYVADAIRKLGYDPQDIKILLNSHAHLDHSGGLAELKELSGAQMIASEGDRSALEGGFYLGSEDNKAFNAPPVEVNVTFSDDFTIAHGGVTLSARITPGHTRGCTSWMMDVEQGGKTYQTLFFCSASVAANRLLGPPQYEGIVDDYRKTFAITKNWKPDVFLSNHPEFFGMATKLERLKAGDPLAFVDGTGFPVFIAKMEKGFQAALQKQTLKHNAIMSE